MLSEVGHSLLIRKNLRNFQRIQIPVSCFGYAQWNTPYSIQSNNNSLNCLLSTHTISPQTEVPVWGLILFNSANETIPFV